MNFSSILTLSLLSISLIGGLSIIPFHICNVSCDNCTNYNIDIDLKCGTDGITYLNECELNCSKKHCNSSLEVLHPGICVDLHTKPYQLELLTSSTQSPLECDPFDNCNCNYDLLLTCGTDGETYPNVCALTCAQKCNPQLKILHYGACN